MKEDRIILNFLDFFILQNKEIQNRQIQNCNGFLD